MLVFEERGKPEYPEKNLSEQGREPTTNSTHIWRQRRELNPGHIGGRRALSPLRHPLLSPLRQLHSNCPILSVKKGTPSDEDLEKLSQQIGKSWKPLGRRLKFKEADLTAFHKENPDEYTEKAYQMLLRWKSRDGKEATYLVLYEALDHELVQQKLLAENICCD